jgi:hypothetical protein
MRTNRLWRVLLGLVLVLETGVGMAATRAPKPKPTSPRVIVYVRQDNLLVAELGRAEKTAITIFASIGVPVVFRAGTKDKSKEESVSIEMQLDVRVPAQFHAGAMAYAMPFGISGTLIHVFCERVRNTSPDSGTGTILGHVMAHEIAHVLEGVNRHSVEGVMKARWEIPDYRLMRSGTLPFDPADEELIHSTLEKGATQSKRAEPLPR